MNFPMLAGTISSIIFAIGVLPMVFRATSTKDMHSYSLTNLILANVGNSLHAVYIYSLPPGPLWLLHLFNMVTTALMLFWRVRYGQGKRIDLHPISSNRDPCGCQ